MLYTITMYSITKISSIAGAVESSLVVGTGRFIMAIVGMDVKS